ncbi:alpha/beta fold hydrolase [Maribacter sp. CXY002]|uniref:alpha/beta fold hydrolase n=1 Tax=Maribacter luteocoastalis TaxID=3407671 RepID=UPI003B67E461
MKKQLTKVIAKFYGQLLNFLALFNPEKAAVKGFDIFCTVRKGKILSNQKLYLDPFKHKVHLVADHKIQTYTWQGEKETVLLVHGWESNTWRWHKLIEKLTEANFNIIAFDAPAHGYSSGNHLYVPLYAEALDFMLKTYRPNHVIGHSVGGMTILYNEYRNPNSDIEKIVTIGSPSEFHEIMSHYQNLLGFNNKVLTALDDYIKKRFDFTIREFSTSHYAKTNTKKGLLFHDKLDPITPYHASEQVHSNWNASEFISTEGLGHSMHQVEVNEKIVAFLSS